MLFNVRPTNLDENVFDITLKQEKYESLSQEWAETGRGRFVENK